MVLPDVRTIDWAGELVQDQRFVFTSDSAVSFGPHLDVTGVAVGW